VKSLGIIARVLKPIYGIVMHGMQTNKKSIDVDNQALAIKKIEAENALLYLEAKVIYMG
jgi:hypothetical protein